ncbi:TRAP transporter small permease subunit [Oharaeibacter diazotrophicus]|uniref:TRAP transporter small permease protein n=1 Tax=Oharaeibacter diazotrophicus TaxID=1920512 RepID=A0A4R6RF96_9HYPH|nr:TRAP transporter small permease subunit [Oharaeibacter diazotrophicus]TDP84902.1 TRAP-type mannitol/chloroaromatic compound transport system permease small subunit [Oharaeibacter diazotrophicus]BBE73873.1 tripartite ATP-independent periplasmic transporters, DctQ component [Pleomorphomonas sp. SM30]GLS76442.1 C4-dicarboxylate ABC transporter [Oharaeibacter diazotrophicus]
MAFLLTISRGIDALNAVLSRAVMWLVLVAILISAGNAVVRKLFSISSNAFLEAQWYLFSAVFLIAAGYALQKGEHVKIDLVYGRLSRRTQIWIEIFGTIFFLLPFCIVTVWLVWPVVADKIATGETSANAGGLPMWPVWILIPAGFIPLGLQGLSELVKRVAFLTGQGPDPALAHEKQPH